MSTTPFIPPSLDSHVGPVSGDATPAAPAIGFTPPSLDSHVGPAAPGSAADTLPDWGKEADGDQANPHGFIGSIWDKVNPVTVASGLWGYMKAAAPHLAVGTPDTGQADYQPFPELQKEHDFVATLAQHLKNGEVGTAINQAAGALVPGLKEGEQQFQAGNYGGAAGTALGSAAQLYLMKKLSEAPGYTLDKAADLSNYISGGDPIDSLIQATKPRSSLLNFRTNLDYSGMGDAKNGEALLGHPVENIDDALQAVKLEKQNNRLAYGTFGGPDRAVIPVDLTPAANAMDTSIPTTLLHEAQQGVPSSVSDLTARKAQSSAYRTTVPLARAEAMLRDANSELDSFYAKYPRAQWSTLQTNPDTAATYAKARALRDSVYSALENYGEGTGARSLNKRYGNLIELEEELQRRKNVADRQQPQSLSEQIGKVSAIGHAVRGVGKVALGAATGHAAEGLSGALDLAQGAAQGTAAKWLKEQQSTNNLIKRSFANYKESPKPYPTYTPVHNLRITSGDIITPPPADTSGPQYNPRNNPMQPGQQRQLPASTAPYEGAPGAVNVPDIIGSSSRGEGTPHRLIAAPPEGTVTQHNVDYTDPRSREILAPGPATHGWLPNAPGQGLPEPGAGGGGPVISKRGEAVPNTPQAIKSPVAKTLTEAKARDYMSKAGGDITEARRMAVRDGYSLQ